MSNTLLLFTDTVAMLQKILTHSKAEIYWFYSRIQGEQSLSLGDTTARFHPERSKGGKINALRFLYERDEIADLLQELRPDDVFYDVGANTGLYTYFAAQKLEAGTVVAFEPYPPNVRQLRENRKQNQGDVQIYSLALSNEVDELQFEIPSSDRVGFGKGKITEKSSNETITVPTTTGDTLIQDGEIQEPNVIKIDVEGSEYEVIEGLKDTLSSNICRTVYVEIHSGPIETDNKNNIGQLESVFENHGFKTVKLARDSHRYLLKAYRYSNH